MPSNLPAAGRRWRSLCGAFAAVLISICWNGPAMAESIRGESQTAAFNPKLVGNACCDRVRAAKTVAIEQLRPNPFQPRRQFEPEN